MESSLKNFKQCILADDPGDYGDGAGMDNKVSGSTDMVERRVMPLATLGQGKAALIRDSRQVSFLKLMLVICKVRSWVCQGCTSFPFKLDALLHQISLEVGAEHVPEYSERVISCTSDQGLLTNTKTLTSPQAPAGAKVNVVRFHLGHLAK